jgi:hypothetical protein
LRIVAVKPEPPERRRGNGNDHFGETVLVLTGTTAWSALTNTEQMVAGRVVVSDGAGAGMAGALGFQTCPALPSGAGFSRWLLGTNPSSLARPAVWFRRHIQLRVCRGMKQSRLDSLVDSRACAGLAIDALTRVPARKAFLPSLEPTQLLCSGTSQLSKNTPTPLVV